ncbi:type 1 glutamine amidotransferase domain-containing protein [Sneathiella marina]|uniref:Type 1 glutamine amidotransferase domain-containing protein n=1 Tax=Sneathiella marina TaxID=2950108 RepID=A0ABY4WBN9_9PROT|nr:type 1 glutamine amidotransferase domain-containing protein [Sneathiella marina]USG63190.1 type 1 glutamine amidotransferase domain-containing protein [Sneathiella marina]
MNILMILTSHDKLGNTGDKTGFWLEEFAAPYYVMKDAGAQVTLASPKGGEPPLDPKSNDEAFQTTATRRFYDDPEAQKDLAHTRKLGAVDFKKYDAVFYPGGHGPLWDLAESRTNRELLAFFDINNRPIGAVCHAPGIFRHVTGRGGKALVHGRKVTGFTNGEEEAVGLSDIVPFLVEDMLIDKGALYSKTDDWAPYTVIDGNLVTGQNPASSERTAGALMAQLTARQAA